MHTPTKIEKAFIRKIVKYCETHPGVTPGLLFTKIRYNNMDRVRMFMNGECSINLNTMGRLDEWMKKNK